MSYFPKIHPFEGPGSSRQTHTTRNVSNLPDKNDSLYNVDNDLAPFTGNKDRSSFEKYPGVEISTYDFSNERNIAFETNLFEATAHLIKGCLGGGLLIIHMGFMFAGIWTALAVTITLGLFVFNSMYMLISSAHKLYVRLRLPRLSYPDVTEAAFATSQYIWLRKFSKVMRYFVDTCLICQLSGTCCVYEIMIASTTKSIMEYVSPTIREEDITVRYYLVIIAGPLVLISLIRKLKVLAPFSFVADVFVGICVIATIYYSLQTDGRISDRPAWKNLDGFVKCCGIGLYTLDGLAVVMPVENSMRQPQYYGVVIHFAMGVVITLATVTGFFGYWGYGEHCMTPITMHMPSKIVPMILQGMLAIMLSVTFAVNFWVAFRVIWHYIGRKYMGKHRDCWERFYRVIHVLAITGVAIIFPYLIRLIIFLGNFFLAFTVFIFPALIESLVHHVGERKRQCHILRLIKNLCLVIIGIMFACGAFYSSVDVQLLNNHPSLVI